MGPAQRLGPSLGPALGRPCKIVGPNDLDIKCFKNEGNTMNFGNLSTGFQVFV